MYWNSEVSLNTFIFSIFVLLLIIYNNAYTQYKIHELNNKWTYAFMASFIFMQLIEFFIWRNLNNKYNKVFTSMAICLLMLQPIFSLMMIKEIKLRNILISIYTIIALPYSIYKYSNMNIRSTVTKSGHLRWNLSWNLFFSAIWMILFFYGIIYSQKWMGAIIAIVLLFISYYNYNYDGSLESHWCWIINGIMIYYALYLLFYLPYCEKRKIC